MSETFDIVVIGGGSAGCAVAGRLAEDGRRSVCLLEAGGRNEGWKVTIPGLFAIPNPASNYMYETVPQKGLDGRTGYQPRGKGLGGSSAINAMIYIRGNAWDYDSWRALGCTGWGWDDVLPVFKRAEDNVRGADAFHGAKGPLHVDDQRWPNPGSRAFVAAAGRLQLPLNDDFNGARQEGFGLFQVTQKGGERWSTARAYLGEPRRPNLDVRTGAMVQRLVVEEGRVAGVAMLRDGCETVLRARGGVVLSAGAFNSPQILMLSGIGPAAHLREHGIDVLADRAAVGANLQDHIDYVSVWRSPSRDFFGKTLAGTWRMAKALLEHRRKRTGIMTTCFAEAGGFLALGAHAPAPDIQWHFVPAMLEDHGRADVKGHGFSLHACVLRPESRGTVSLASPNAADAPVIDPNFLDDPRDIGLLREGVRLSHRIAATPPLADYAPEDRYPVDLADDEAMDALIRARADTVYHPVGTCRMGSDAGSVVDPQLRSRDVQGLWVADASVMPRIVSGNTNAPSIMIGERCADFVRRS